MMFRPVLSIPLSVAWSLTLFIELLILRRLNNLTWPADHFMQRGARCHHWIDGVFLLHPEINKYRPVMIARRPHRGHNLRTFGDCHAPDAISLAEFREIGI